jgi:flagellar hook-length control protein FliK
VATEPAQTSPAQNSIRPAEKNAAVPAQTEYFVPNGAKAADIPPVPAEKLTAEATTSTAFQSERPAAWPIAAAPVSTPESEIEIQISQPQPITARVIAAPVLSDNHPATLIQEARGSRQRLSREQQVEKAGTGNDQVVVKEMAPSLRIVASIGESMAGSDTSQNSDSDQGQPDGFSDNQLLAQDMRGQWRADHQKVGGNAARTVSTESVRQDIPEQVMQQVKERLVQHDVKPGNQQITLTLSPDSLGELKMNLNLQGQKLSVEIITENRTARDAIVQHTDALKESLARQNITMESFDVTTGGKGSGNQGQNQNAWRELTRQQQQQQFWTSPRGYQTAQADLPSGQAAYLRQQGHSMLDIHY